MKTRNIIWIHEDAMRADHPVVFQAGEQAEAVFIWDAAYFEAQGYSAKRLVFIYECLMDLPVVLYVGETETALRELVSGGRLFVPTTPNPYFNTILDNLSGDIDVTQVPDIPLVIAPDDVDLKRFFRFWNKVRKSALTSSEPYQQAAE
ncbi:hypothetical protein ACJ3XI_08380 [Litorimonas sp. RW-G-Af-16]|uniref:hypothetical protein n=1 Tax=Litorimonas sp. RW-G-Af-16 TaxID=3241168 RepID=UPI00390C764A